jgi:uncharacterized membrane protein
MTADEEKRRERRENGSAWFAVLTGAVIGALAFALIGASTAKPSSPMDAAPGVGGAITGLIFGLVIGGIVGFFLRQLWKARRT